MLTEQRLHFGLKLSQLTFHLKRRSARQWVHSIRNRAGRTVFDSTLRRSYERRAKRHSPYLPSVAASERAILQDIEREGIHIGSAGSLDIPFTDEIIRSATALLPKLVRSPATKTGGFRVYADQASLKEFPQLFLWGLNDTVLHMAENYLGVPVGYHNVSVIRSIKNSLDHGARMWHIDGGDHRLFQIIIYLNEVDHDNGPFEYIPRPISEKARKSLRYSLEYVPDGIMRNVVSTKFWKPCVGPRGTMIFADPANVFHRSKTPNRQERYAITYSYHSAEPMYPRYLTPGFSPDFLASMEDRLSERQRTSVFWRN